MDRGKFWSRTGPALVITAVAVAVLALVVRFGVPGEDPDPAPPAPAPTVAVISCAEWRESLGDPLLGDVRVNAERYEPAEDGHRTCHSVGRDAEREVQVVIDLDVLRLPSGGTPDEVAAAARRTAGAFCAGLTVTTGDDGSLQCRWAKPRSLAVWSGRAGTLLVTLRLDHRDPGITGPLMDSASQLGRDLLTRL